MEYNDEQDQSIPDNVLHAMADKNHEGSRKRRSANMEMSTLERKIAKLVLPLPYKDGIPVICCLNFGINYRKRQGTVQRRR